MASLFDNIEFLFSLILSIFLTKKIFFDHEGTPFRQIYDWIPAVIKDGLYGRDVLTYIMAVPLLLLLTMILLRLITTPLYGAVIVPFANGCYSFVDSCGGFAKRLFGSLWQVPRSLYMVFIVGLLLNFYTYYFPAPILSKWMNDSPAYQLLYKGAIYPALNSNIAKKVPVLVNDSFREIGMVIPKDGRNAIPQIGSQIKEELAKRNIRVIEYFNGVTLEEAIESSPEIDKTALKVVGDEKNSKKKAYLLYKWVSGNIKYDYEKAEQVSKSPKGTSSGAVVAYNTKKGICFDYSCLYIAMCRAAGVKVRLVTGLGYSGVAWGDHAWNQVFSAEENRWINVDATFGSAADYFDKKDFGVDHMYAEIQGEW